MPAEDKRDIWWDASLNGSGELNDDGKDEDKDEDKDATAANANFDIDKRKDSGMHSRQTAPDPQCDLPRRPCNDTKAVRTATTGK